MYAPPNSASMNNNDTNLQHMHQQGTSPSHIAEEDDDVQCTNGAESIDDISPSQIRYDPPNGSHSPHALPVMESVSSHALYGSEIAPPAPPLAGGEGSADQLTLTFQGQVYVFDSVSPEKVQAVLLLLGGYELSAGISTSGMTPQNHRSLDDYPAKSSQPQRAASLNRFREKRKERCFDKKIRYTVRKEVALRMQRKKGQFTSSKSALEEPGSSADWNGSSGQEEQETSCRHCGISSKSTPMMRRGPDGPRTLCNACGLKWANKGVLRELSKVPIVGGQHHNHTMQLNGEAHGENSVIPASNVIISSNGGS